MNGLQESPNLDRRRTEGTSQILNGYEIRRCWVKVWNWFIWFLKSPRNSGSRFFDQIFHTLIQQRTTAYALSYLQARNPLQTGFLPWFNRLVSVNQVVNSISIQDPRKSCNDKTDLPTSFRPRNDASSIDLAKRLANILEPHHRSDDRPGSLHRRPRLRPPPRNCDVQALRKPFPLWHWHLLHGTRNRPSHR